MDNEKHQRKQYIVQPKFQKKLILRFLYVICCTITIGTATFFYTYQSKKETGKFFYITDELGSDPVVTDRIKIILPVLITTGLLGISLGTLFGLYYSHRLAGPIYRIHSVVESLIANRPVKVPVILRKGDEFQELAEAINRLVVKLQNEIPKNGQES